MVRWLADWMNMAEFWHWDSLKMCNDLKLSFKLDSCVTLFTLNLFPRCPSSLLPIIFRNSFYVWSVCVVWVCVCQFADSWILSFGELFICLFFARSCVFYQCLCMFFLLSIHFRCTTNGNDTVRIGVGAIVVVGDVEDDGYEHSKNKICNDNEWMSSCLLPFSI